MNNLNRIIIAGNIGRDPELKHTTKGNAFCQLSIATNRKVKNALGEERSETTWHRATVWGRTAENCHKYLMKGSRIYLEGELQTRDWKDKEGNDRRTSEISVDSIQFLSGTRPQSSGETAPEAALVQ